MQIVSPTSHRLRPLALALAILGALVLPSAASAGTLTVDHTAHAAVYEAAAGEANDLSFYRLASDYRIQDQPTGSVPLTEFGGALCSMGEPWKYRCPVASVATARVSLGDGADNFNASNTAIAFTLTAGSGVKTITTGGGDDSIAARNGSADRVACGAGADSVDADPDDAVDASCEQVDRDGGPSTGDGSGATTGDQADGTPDAGSTGGDSQDVFETPLGLTVAIATVPVSNHRAHVRLACAAAEGCRGVVTLNLPARRPGADGNVTASRGQYVAQQRRRGRRIGRRSYRIETGEKQTVAVPLLRGHYRYVSRRRRKQRVILRVAERDQAGNVIDIQTRSVTLKLPKRTADNGGQR